MKNAKILSHLFNGLIWLRSLLGISQYRTVKLGTFYKRVKDSYRQVNAIVTMIPFKYGFYICRVVEYRENEKLLEYYKLVRNIKDLGLLDSFINDLLDTKNKSNTNLISIDLLKTGDSSKIYMCLVPEVNGLVVRDGIIFNRDVDGIVHVYGIEVDILAACKYDVINGETVTNYFHKTVKCINPTGGMVKPVVPVLEIKW